MAQRYVLLYCTVYIRQLDVVYSETSDKGPSEKRTASVERTVRNVPKLSFPIAVMHF